MKPSKVLEAVRERTGIKLSHFDHKCLLEIFSVRPDPEEDVDPFNTNSEYCMYDELHDDYVYFEAWVDCLVKILLSKRIERSMWKQASKHKRRYDIKSFF